MKRLVLSAVAVIALGSGAAMARHHDDDFGGRGPGIVLFSKPGFQGRSVFVDHEVRKLGHKDMDDKVTSIRVLGGAWQLCEDDDFGGRCAVIDRSMPDLNGTGMNNKISSVRPVPPGAGGWQH